MSFSNKATVLYRVYSLDVWGDDGDWTVNDRREAGSISVKTDRKNKAGRWDVSNGALIKALVAGSYLNNWVTSRDLDIDGEDDGVIFVDDHDGGYPFYQLEYERHHDIEEPSKGLFGEPTASKENPLSSGSGLSTGTKIALAAGGVAVVGALGYWLYSKSQAAQQAAVLPVVQTPAAPGLPVVQTPALPAPAQDQPAPPNPAAYPPAWLNQTGATPGVDEQPNPYAYPSAT